MKKISFVAAIGLAALATNAAPVTINHSTAGALATELQAALAEVGQTEMSYITELTITGEAVMNETDFAAIRTHLRPSLQKIDLSNAKFASTALPGNQYNQNGVLNNMHSLTAVVLPENLTALTGGAFQDCENLVSINLPDKMATISDYAFKGCSSLILDKLPTGLKTVREYAFQTCTSLTVSELPAGVTYIGQYAFHQSSVSFSTLPEGLQKLRTRGLAGTKVTLSTLPSTLTDFETYVFQSVRTLPEFTIPDVAGLWTKIPDATFWLMPEFSVMERSFICRAPQAPAAKVNAGKDSWDGVFGRGSEFPNITFKVLASAYESYAATAPYNTMNLVKLTTEVREPSVDIASWIPEGLYSMSFVVNGEECTDFSKVLEGEGTFKIVCDEKLYVDEVRYAAAPVALAEGEAGEGTEEPADPDLLYKVDDPWASLNKTVEVPVTITPGMRPLYVKFGSWGELTGVTEVETPTVNVDRRGDVLYLSASGAELYNIAGSMVASTCLNSLDLSYLPAGVYILRAGKTVCKIVK